MQGSLLLNKLHRPPAGKTARVVSWEFRKREQELVRTTLALSNRFWLVLGSVASLLSRTNLSREWRWSQQDDSVS